jgi:hypothetical protein
VAFTATMSLADVSLVAWLLGSMWGIAIAAGIMVGMMISIAWAVRRYRPEASIGLLILGAVLTSVVAVTSPGTAGLEVGVALSVFGVWFLAYDVWFTGRANAECASPVTTLGSDGWAGRALIVHHQGRGPTHFQARMQRAFAEGLQAQGWQVDLTTASRQAPRDVSRYDLLVFGTQAYNWCPSQPIVGYVDRVVGLKGKPVVVVVSGGGMTERAMRILQMHVRASGGVIVKAIEIWTSRPNEEHHGLSDPAAIMRYEGSHLMLVRQQKTA